MGRHWRLGSSWKVGASPQRTRELPESGWQAGRKESGRTRRLEEMELDTGLVVSEADRTYQDEPRSVQLGDYRDDGDGGGADDAPDGEAEEVNPTR